MSELYEIIFENVDKNKVNQLCLDLIGDYKNIKNLPLNQKIDFMSILNIEEWFFFNLKEIKILSFTIFNIGLRGISYEKRKKIDIEINFDFNDIKNNKSRHLQRELMLYSQEKAVKFNIKNYFAGLEPACDENTRIFTKNKIGPIKI